MLTLSIDTVTVQMIEAGLEAALAALAVHRWPSETRRRVWARCATGEALAEAFAIQDRPVEGKLGMPSGSLSDARIWPCVSWNAAVEAAKVAVLTPIVGVAR